MALSSGTILALLFAVAAAVVGVRNTAEGDKVVLPPAVWLYPDDPELQAKASFYLLCGLSLIAAVADLQGKLKRGRMPDEPPRRERRR